MTPTDTNLAQILEALEHRVAHFVRHTSANHKETFDSLALAVLRLQIEHLPGYQRLCAARGVTVNALTDWQHVPPVPTSAFQQQHYSLKQPELIFRSSGTSQGVSRRSEHPHGNLDLYRLIVDHSFPQAVLTPPEDKASLSTRAPFLSLIAPPSVVTDSSLGFMADHVIRRFGTPESAYAFSAGELDFGRAQQWLAAQCAEGDSTDHERRPGPVLLTTALALWTLLEHKQETDGSAHWPDRLRVMETGGFKTRRFELDRSTLIDRLQQQTGVGEERVVREYGMTELTSQSYASLAIGHGNSETFSVPHWMRVRALDPTRMVPVQEGQPGLLAFLDLGNVASAASIVTEDLGTVAPARHAGEGGLFTLLGRAANAQLRGCSLTTETLLEDTER